jgi:hypothetical protein
LITAAHHIVLACSKDLLYNVFMQEAIMPQGSKSLYPHVCEYVDAYVGPTILDEILTWLFENVGDVKTDLWRHSQHWNKLGGTDSEWLPCHFYFRKRIDLLAFRLRWGTYYPVTSSETV